jgi:uncharacterized glyoxalase superfamily protein PhnB
MPGYAAIPSLRFKDLPAAIRFYRDTLGFTLDRGDETEPNVAVTRGDARLMLESATAFYSAQYNEAIAGRIGGQAPNSLYIEAEDLDALHSAVAAASVPIVDPLAEREWGQREFTIADPAGNWLTFWKALG